MINILFYCLVLRFFCIDHIVKAAGVYFVICLFMKYDLLFFIFI
jgi:hypothetical protein